MEKSFFNGVENGEFKKEGREDIVKCLDDERKANLEIDKRLYELELNMFTVLMKEIDWYIDYHSETVSKLRDFIWLYSYLLDIDKKNGICERRI